MSEEFKVHFEADLDTSAVERKARELQNKKLKIDADTSQAKQNVDGLNSSMKTAAKTSKTFGDSLKSALGIGSAAALAYKSIRLIGQAAREATSAVKEIDSAITDLRIVTNESYATVSQWMEGYNEMARSLGATTTQVAESATTWLRQGKSAQEANALIKDSMVLSKIGMIDSASAAEYLTSAMKGYHVEVENATKVVDKLGKLDSSAAVTAGDLAQGMSKVAQMANDTGVSMDTLLGYLSAVGEVTQDVTSAGTAFKTIFSRMSDIKAEKFELVDEDGTTETLSNVETTLKNVGIDLRKTVTEFNSFDDVLANLAGKWDSLNNVQQAALSKAFAGVRQQNTFRVLMANYDKAKEYASLAADSAGVAEEKFGAYLDSIEAKTNTLTASFESLATHSFSADSFKWILEAAANIVTFTDKTNILKGALAGLAVAGAVKGFTSLASVISSTVVKFTQFNEALQLVKAGNIGAEQISQLTTLTSNLSKSQLQAVLSSKALSVEQRIAILTAQGMSTAEAEAALASMGLATAEGTATGATATFSGALKGLWATLKANPLILIASAIGIAVAAFNSYQQSIEDAKRATTEKIDNIAQEKSQIESLINEYKELANADKSDSGTREKIKNVQSEITKLVGAQADNLDLVNGKLDDELNKLKNISAEEVKNNIPTYRENYNNKSDDTNGSSVLHKGFWLDNLMPWKSDDFLISYDYLPSEFEQELQDKVKDVFTDSIEKYGGHTWHDYGSFGFKFDNGATNKDKINYINDVLEGLTNLKGYDTDSALFSVLTTFRNDLQDKINEQTNAGKQLVENLIVDFDNNNHNQVKSFDDYLKYREKLANDLANDKTVSQMLADGIFDEDTLQKSVDDYLSGLDDFSDYYNKWYKNVGSEQAKALQHIQLNFGKNQSFKGDPTDPKSFEDNTKRIKEFNTWINGLSKKDKETVYKIYCDTDEIDNSKWTLDQWEAKLEEYGSTADEVSETITQSYEKTSNVVSGVSKIFGIVKEQSVGKSIALDVFNSDEVKDYTSALEYQNGVYQLNADKVNEIVKSKTKEQIATNKANKAIAQSKYLQNAAEIEQLRQKIIDKNYAENESKESVENSINALLNENSSLADNIDKYNLMTSSLEEVTGAYQNWLNSQKATQSGDMFDDTINAINRINETLNDKSSDYYGRVGRTDYKAAVDLIIPDSVNSEDKEKVNNYLKSIKDLFTYDGDGNRAGLNIENFCQEAVDKGLMVLDKSTNEYKIKGQTTMKEFAEGLNLSMPLVQAMFGEMEEFGGKFSWADEADKTIGDLAVSANKAAEALRKTNDINITLDTSKIEGTKNKVDTLETTIKQMQNIKGKANVDSSEIDYANQVIEYCIKQQQELTKPVIMDVNTAKLDEKTADVVKLLQDYQTAYNELEKNKKLGVDTSEAKKKVKSLASQIKKIPTNISTVLGIDTSSNEKIKKSIGNISADKLVQIGVDDSAIVGYNPKNKKAKVKYSVDTTEVDKYNPKNLERTLTYNIKTKGKSKLNGTANANGTALASGNWRTKEDGATLTGELGAELVVTKSGKWYTVGDHGAEFVDIPKGAIVFNHRQTEGLLKNGSINSRGTALASGNAFVTGGISVKNAKGSSQSRGNSTDNYGKTKDTKTKTKTDTDSKEKTALEKFQNWFKRLFDWIEIKLEKQTDKISNYVNKAERAKDEGSYKRASKNYRFAVSSTASLIDTESKAAKKYKGKANSVLNKALSQGIISKTEKASIKKGVENGKLKISDYREEIRETISSYKDFADKANTAKKAMNELHDKIREYIKDLKDVQDAQRDAKIDEAQSFLTIATSGVQGTQKNKSAVLDYKNNELGTEYNAYKSATEQSSSNVTSLGKRATKAIKKAKTKGSKKYKNALKNARKAIKKRVKVSNSDLKTIKKHSLSIYNRLYAYNLSIDNYTTSLLEQDVNYATSYTQKLNNRAEKYSNKDEKSNNNISLYKSRAENAKSAKKANEYLAKASKEYDTIIKNDKAEINSYKNSMDSAAKSAVKATRYAKGIKKLNKKDKKAVKTFVNNIVKKVKARKEITVNEINKLAKYHTKGYITTSFYNSVYRYYDNYQSWVQAKAQLDIDEETRKQEQANIRQEQFNNIKEEVQKQIDRNKTKTEQIEAQQAINTAKGIQMTAEDYQQLIAQGDVDIENLKQQQQRLQNWLDNSGLDKNSEEYQNFADQIAQIGVSIQECERSQIEYNNAITQIPFDKLEKAVGLYDAIKSRISAYIDLQQALGKDEGEASYFGKIAETQKDIQEYAEGYARALENAGQAAANPDGTNTFDGKTADEWTEMAEGYLQKQYEAELAEKNIYNELLDYRLRPFEKAIEQAEYLENVLKGVESLISDDMLIDKNGKLTQYGIANLALLTSGYENAREKVKTYGEELAKLNEEYAKGELNIIPDEFNKRVNDIQKSMLDSAADMQSNMKSMINLYRDMAQAELDTLFDLVEARNKSLQAKKDYYSWDKTLRSKTKDIQSLENQLAALEGLGNTAEVKAKRAQLMSDLAEAQEDLDDSINEHYIDLSQDSLSEMKDTLKDAFDETWDKISSDLEASAKIVAQANELASSSVNRVNYTLSALLKHYGIDMTGEEINVRKGYASGIRTVLNNENAYINEKGRELITTKKGIIAPLAKGDGVIPANLTDNLLELASGNMASSLNVSNFEVPTISQNKGDIIYHYDNLINIEGSADAATVDDLKRFSKDFLEQSYQYTSQKIYRGARKGGAKRRV